MTRKNINLSPIDSDTVVNYIDKLVIVVEKKIKEALPSRSGIIYDVWFDQTSTLCVSIYALFPFSLSKERTVRRLGFSPLSTEKHVSTENCKKNQFGAWREFYLQLEA